MSDEKQPGEGKGWGNGVAVRNFNASRKTNPANTYTSFRPRTEREAEYFVIREWCDDERVNKSFSAIINSLIPAIKIACEHTTERDEHGRITIELNAGRIEIR